MTEASHNSIELSNPPTSEELFALGSACLATTAEVDLLSQHEAFSENPNTVGRLDVPFKSGEVATEPDMVYRQVGIEAIQDLARSGIVRNGATAEGQEHKRWGHDVFWSEGSNGAHMNTAGRAIIVAPKSATQDGWVTSNKVKSIYTQSPSGEVIDLLAEAKQ